MMDREEMLFCVIWGLNFFDLDLVFFCGKQRKTKRHGECGLPLWCSARL